MTIANRSFLRGMGIGILTEYKGDGELNGQAPASSYPVGAGYRRATKYAENQQP